MTANYHGKKIAVIMSGRVFVQWRKCPADKDDVIRTKYDDIEAWYEV